MPTIAIQDFISFHAPHLSYEALIQGFDLYGEAIFTETPRSISQTKARQVIGLEPLQEMDWLQDKLNYAIAHAQPVNMADILANPDFQKG